MPCTTGRRPSPKSAGDVPAEVRAALCNAIAENQCKSQKKYNRRVGRYTYWCYKCKLDGSDCETRRLRAQDSWYDEEEELYSNRRSLRSPYEDEEVGGGKIYGEYNKGPVKVGGEWNFDETEENVGGFSVYGEYEKGPVKVGGEWDFDEEEDESVGYGDDFGRPSHTRPHMPDGNSIGNWINFRL